MQAFSVSSFLGTIPKLSPKKLGANYAQIAHNCFVDSGELVPLKAPLKSQDVSPALNPIPRTIFNLDDNWIIWDKDVDAEQSIIPDIYEEVLEQVATGGGALVLIDSNVNFKASGVKLGMEVKNLTKVLSGVIQDISTTTNPFDTILVDTSVDFVAGDIYQVLNEQTADFRFYYTGDGSPKQSTKSLAIPAVTGPGPENYYNLGIRKPPTVLTLTKTGTPSGTVEKTVVYVYTLVNVFGEESQPSTTTEPLDVEGGETVVISNLSSQAGTDDGIEYVRIYRSITGTSTAQLQLVDQLPIADFPDLAATYTDTVTDDLLGNILASSSYIAPPEGMLGLCKFNNMVYAGFFKNTVYFSEPNQPHAWPHTYDLPYEIIGIESFDNQLIVVTTEIPYVLTGTDPLAVAVNPLPTYQPGYGKKAIVSTPYGVIFISPDGLILIQNSVTYKVLSENILPRGYLCQDRVYHLTYVDQKLFISNDSESSGGFILLDQIEAGLFTYDTDTFTDVTGFSVYRDSLYALAKDDTAAWIIMELDKGANLVLKWQSKDIVFNESGDYQNGKVTAEGLSFFKLFVDGVEIPHPSGDKEVLTAEPFRLPSGKRGRVFSFQVCSKSNVSYLGLGDSTHDFA